MSTLPIGSSWLPQKGLFCCQSCLGQRQIPSFNLRGHNFPAEVSGCKFLWWSWMYILDNNSWNMLVCCCYLQGQTFGISELTGQNIGLGIAWRLLIAIESLSCTFLCFSVIWREYTQRWLSGVGLSCCGQLLGNSFWGTACLWGVSSSSFLVLLL